MKDYVNIFRNGIIFGIFVFIGLMVYTPLFLRQDPVVDPEVKAVRCSRCPISIPKILAVAGAVVIGLIVLQLVVSMIGQMDTEVLSSGLGGKAVNPTKSARYKQFEAAGKKAGDRFRGKPRKISDLSDAEFEKMLAQF